MTSLPKTCPDCGAALPAGLPSVLCSRCALNGLLERDAAPEWDHSLPHSWAQQTFGDFEILEEIARGGMGVVYRARHTALGRIVAVKRLLLGAQADAESVKRFRAAASVAAGLHHPHIVSIHEVGVQQGEPYLVMDYVDGANLAQLIKNDPLPARRAATYLKAIAEAVHYAHERGVLHRDLKPANVLIDAEGHPRVIDFGLAKHLARGATLTTSGQVIGTPGYMPPEQATATRHQMSRRSDVYSLGALLYHALTGRPPFAAEELSQLLDQVLHQDPVSPRLLNPAVPRDLETICLKCLEKEPGRRYGTAREVADECGRFLRSEPIRARPVGRAERAWRWCLRRPALAVVTGIATVLFLVVAIGSPLVALHLRDQRRRVEEDLYVSHIRLAGQHLDQHQLHGAREALRLIGASPIQRALRGWEWRFLADRCRGDHLAQLSGHQAAIASLDFSPDDRWLASLGEDGEARLWDWARGELVAAWPAHRRPEETESWAVRHSVAFSRDGRYLATGGSEGVIHLWDPTTRERRVTLSVNDDREVTRIAFSPDGRLLAAATPSGKISWWDLTHPEPEFSGQVEASSPAYAGVFDGGIAFAGHAKELWVEALSSIRRWDLSDPQRPVELPPLEGMMGFVLSPDGEWFVGVQDQPWTFHTWSLPEMKPMSPTLPAHSTWGLLAIFPGRERLASADNDGNITLVDLTGKRSNTVLKGHEGQIFSLTLAHRGAVLASGGRDRMIRIWNGDLDRPTPTFLAHSGKVQDIQFLNDSRSFLTVGLEHSPSDRQEPGDNGQSTVKRWEVDRWELGSAITNRGAPGHQRLSVAADQGSVAFNEALAGPWTPNQLRIASLPDLGVVREVRGSHAAESADGSVRVYAQGNRLVRRDHWEAAPRVLGTMPKLIVNVALSPDGRTVATAIDTDPVVSLWDPQHDRPPVHLRQHDIGIHMLAFSPDSRWLASASWDHTVGLADARAGQARFRLKGHRAQVNCVAFSANGETLASGSSDGTVRLWHVRAGRELAVLPAEIGDVWSVAFSPDGQWLLAGGKTGGLQRWRAPSFSEIEEAKLVD